MPVEIEEMDRNMQLEIEREALKKQRVHASPERLENFQAELADLTKRRP